MLGLDGRGRGRGRWRLPGGVRARPRRVGSGGAAVAGRELEREEGGMDLGLEGWGGSVRVGWPRVRVFA